MIFGSILLLFALKGLGGSFNALFNQLGLSSAHGPFVGGAFGMGLSYFLFRFRTPKVPSQKLDRSLRLFLTFSLSALLVSGVVVRYQKLKEIPIDEGRADMLVTITSQIQDHLAGKDPYAPYVTPTGRTLDRFYLPTLWLSYLPFYKWGLDIRYLNVIVQVLVLLLVFLSFMKKGSSPPLSPRTTSLLFLVLIALFLFSKQKIYDVLDVQTAPFWFFYSIVLWAESNAKPWINYLAIPLTLACRHPAILLFLPFVLHVFLNDKRRFWIATISSLAIVSLTIFPFMENPYNIIQSILFYGGSLKSSPLEITTKFYGLSALLQVLHLERLQLPLQLSGLIFSLFWVYRRRNLDEVEALALGGISYCTFILFVSSTPAYIWAELILLVYFLIFCPPKTNGQTP